MCSAKIHEWKIVNVSVHRLLEVLNVYVCPSVYLFVRLCLYVVFNRFV